MVTNFPDWLCNLMLWGAVFALAALSYDKYVAPLLSGTNALIGLGAAAVLSLLWPRY
jgi:hypothetical protein